MNSELTMYHQVNHARTQINLLDELQSIYRRFWFQIQASQACWYKKTKGLTIYE